MRLFLAIKKDEQKREYIAAIINSKSYPSTYAADNKGVRIVELPEIKDGEKVTGCHICL
jgi:hypothetical protein|uniref:Uncharacterized protein n=1 Tax=Bacteriophage sp. TaxID=38018 RepID=A0A8D9PGP4_9VIRU|nr:MAG TPA: hypothetical protein [Bacteriophage sp.]